MHRWADSHVRPWAEQDVRTTLVEGDPESARRIDTECGSHPHITVRAVAVTAEDGPVALVRRGPSSYLGGIAGPPAVVNDGYRFDETDVVRVPGVRFDRIDDGSIDLLSVDIEGGEWDVLRRMVSRPAVLKVETHGAAYLNPQLEAIRDWAASRGYRVLFKDRTDTVWVDPGVIRVGPLDRLRLLWTELRLVLRRFRKRLHPADPRPDTRFRRSPR